MENIWTRINDNIKIYLKDIILDYNMKVVKISPLKTALIKDNFALIISIDRFAADVSFVRRIDNKLEVLPCDSFFAEKFSKEDRKDLLEGSCAKNIIINDLIIINNGLRSKWSNVLNGDTTWIADYKRSKWYDTYSLRPSENDILDNLIK